MGLYEKIILNVVRQHFPRSILGKPPADTSTLLQYMLLVLKSGMAWRHLSDTACPYNYRTVQGHIPIPKKTIVKALAVRGLTFLVDEFNTSKMCPCGQCALCDDIR